MTDDNVMNKAMKKMFFWLIIGIGISFGVNFGMFMLLGDAAFPWNIIVLVGIFMLLGYLVQKRELKKVGAWKDKPKGSGWFRSKSGGRGYTCYNCGETYKGDRCPKCGARGGRMQFE